ncbi:hypothetical protein CAP35_13915 [Chitinophagaceae bacterium IBVUCB1]|nr:hypothetical protein CAP35_13915 [Chitinophagaceae bacterium IBVUCB1]
MSKKNWEFRVCIELSDDDKRKLKSLLFDAGRVVMSEEQIAKHDEWLNEMSSLGILDTVVVSWGYEQHSYRITRVGRQIIAKL